MLQVMPARCKVSVSRLFVDSIVDSIVLSRFVSALNTTVYRVLWSPDLTTRSNTEDSPRAVMLFTLCLQPLHPNKEALPHHIECARIKLLALFYSPFHWVSIERKRTLTVRKSKARWVVILHAALAWNLTNGRLSTIHVVIYVRGYYMKGLQLEI